MKKQLFNERLHIALDRSGVTQKALASETGISQASIAQYLKGTFMPKQPRVKALAKALKVNALWLQGETNNMQLPSLATTLRGAKHFMEQNEDYSYLSEEERYELELQEAKHSLNEEIKTLEADQVIYLAEHIKELITIDNKDYDLLALFSNLNEEAKEKSMDFMRILNEIPRYCVKQIEKEKNI